MKQVLHIIAALCIIGIISGGVLQMVNSWAAPKIKANQKAETERGIFLVQPAGKTYEAVNKGGLEVYKVFDENQTLAGYSLAHSGNGFQGSIRLMVGLSPDLNQITSLEILEQSETPGLGTKITEDDFKSQFTGLVTNPLILWIKGAPASKQNEVQTITGATISSKSIVEIINDGVKQLRKLKESGEGL